MATTRRTRETNTALAYAVTYAAAYDLLLALEAALTPPKVRERIATLHTAIERLDHAERIGMRLDEALQAVDGVLEFLPDNRDLVALRQQLVDAQLMRLVKSGFASWSGEKPRGATPRVRLDIDKPLSDYVIENRR
jgi:hypothetical protein